MGKTLKHLKKILIHKYWVAHYCNMCGLYKQGFLHDMSKFSPTEFGESIKYYVGISSPIDEATKHKGYSDAWMHHKGRNKHHSSYWVNIFYGKVIPIKMPWKYLLELICDNLGASHAYNMDKFSVQKAYDWWQNARQYELMHEHTKKMISIIYDKMLQNGIDETLKDKKLLNNLKFIYEEKEED